VWRKQSAQRPIDVGQVRVAQGVMSRRHEGQTIVNRSAAVVAEVENVTLRMQPPARVQERAATAMPSHPHPRSRDRIVDRRLAHLMLPGLELPTLTWHDQVVDGRIAMGRTSFSRIAAQRSLLTLRGRESPKLIGYVPVADDLIAVCPIARGPTQRPLSQVVICRRA
jgi:hypothetical protein